jgi:transmembrane sensor
MNAVPFASPEISETAARWVARRDAGLSAGEEEQLASWLRVDPAHREAFERFSALFSAVGRPQRTGDGAALESRLAGLARGRRRRRAAVAGAGVAVVAAALAFLLVPRWAPEGRLRREAGVALLLPQQQLLPDGTRVEYPEGAEFSVDFSARARRIRLTHGEAVFSVAKRPDWPFVVEAGGVEFRAVGTAFSVQLRSGAAELMVTEGRVAVERGGTPLPLPGSGAAGEMPHVVAAGSRVSVALERSGPVAGEVGAVSSAELAERLAWRHPRAEFSGTPLGEIVELLNRQNAVQLVLADEALAGVQLSGVFRTDDLDSLVRALELGFQVRAERHRDEIRLRRAAP